MKRLVTALFALVAVVGMSAHAGTSKNEILRKQQQHAAKLAAQPAVSLRAISGGQFQPVRVDATAAECDAGTPGIVIHDDGEAENGYGWNASANVGRYAEKYTPTLYPAKITTVCAAFITNAGVASFNADIVVYDDDGANGEPGTELGRMSFVVHPDPISGVPATPAFESFDLSSLNLQVADGSVYFSVEWDAATEPAGVFIATDESTSTPLQDGYSGANGDPWAAMGPGSDNPDYRALFIRPVMPPAGPGAPAVAKSFAPAQIMAGETSTLTITLHNESQPSAAVLSADLVDSLPVGVEVAASPNAATTCTNGTVTAPAAGASVTLGTGAEIPAEGSCTVSVDVTSSADGSYQNVIPADALQTQHGNNANPATADLQVGFVFPEPYCSVDFPSAVEPITRVLFAGIDNSSDPTVDGSPALEDFTSVLGNVDPGAALQMAVEGNTNGNYTTVIKVYIDWNQNGVFDGDEGYLIGDIEDSDGTDGKQAVNDITVPLDALPGETRMRVTKKFNSAADACNTTGFGQAEDYTLDVAPINPAPRVDKAFSPTLVQANEPSTLTITLTNDQNAGDATLSADFTDTFPTGLVVASTPNAATTCASGTLTATAGAGSVTLATGAVIPGGGSCTVTVDVESANDDVYNNLIPAGALQTDLGNSPFDASASLQVGYIFPQPYCEIDFPSDVEPITRVLFDGIDNSSDPTVNGSPALENFTSVIGNVRAGKTVQMAVEGNTNGNFTTVVKVYIDWNQDGTFQAGEGTLIGNIKDSDGTDGKQAVGDVQVPVDAVPGETRMRVTKRFNAAADACNTTGYGQAEDYTLQVAPPVPEVSKAFSPETVQINEPATATITVSNPTANDATLTAALEDTFPTGLSVSNVATNCGLVMNGSGGQASLVAASKVTLPAGVVLPAGSSCDITATVQAASAGSYVNTIPAGALQTDQGDSPEDAEATLTVIDSPFLSKSFTPATVQRTQDSTALITLTNPSASDATLTAPLTDNLPSGLVATSASTTCVATGSLTANITADSSISLPAGAVIPANGSCTLSITVHSDSLGEFINEIAAGALQTDQGDNFAPASATLTVEALPSDPVINATPDNLSASQQSNTTTTQTLTIGNTGGSELSWSIDEATALTANPPSFKNSQATGHPGASLVGARSIGLHGHGAAIVLADTDISQMDDNTPGDEGVSCGTQGTSTADNSWWRRFYFDEYPQVGASAGVKSVTISTGSIDVGGLPTTINLYTIPHSTPVDTIPTSALTLIGTTTTTVSGSLTSVTIPVTGSIGNTANSDLVVEWHTEGNASGGQFFPGANATPETHPTFISSNTCSISEPTTTSDIGFPDFHLTMIVTVGEGGGGTCDVTDMPWLSVSPTSGTTSSGGSSAVNVSFDSTNLASGTYTGKLCINSNDPVNPVVQIPVAMTVDANDPVATVTPTSLDFSVAADATADQTLDIANASGSDPLTFSILARGANNAQFRLRPSDRAVKHAAEANKAHPPSLAAANTAAKPAVQNAPWLPQAALDGQPIVYMLDDGSAETAIGWGTQSPPAEAMAIFMNRFAPPAGTGAYTITNVSIMWPTTDQSGAPMTGLEANLVFYYDFDADGDPSNAFRLGGDTLVPINVQGEFVNYPVSISVPGDGDIYIGFADQWAQAGGYTPRIFPAAIDQDASMGMSYISADSEDITDLDNLANNDTTDVIDNLNASLAGNWTIRAVGSTGTTCVGPAVNWLSATPASGSVDGGDSAQVTVTADPAAGGLGAGTYHADLCITTNDPTQPTIAIPVTLEVTPGDAIFCDGFELGGDGSCDTGAPPPPANGSNIIASGPVNIDLPATFDGIYINWETGATCSGDNPCHGQFNAYADHSGKLGFLWPRQDASAAGVGAAAGSGYAVLKSGATIGPGSMWQTSAAAGQGQWADGADGYLGFSFQCPSATLAAPATCYGYAHIVTGKSGNLLRQYWFDASGQPITIP